MKRLLLIAIFAACLVSCGKTDRNAERNDYIRVYADPQDQETPLDRVWVSVKGGTYTYYIRSNVSFTAKWQSEEDSWAEIGEPKSLGDGLWSIDVTVQPVSTRRKRTVDGVPSGTYTRRYGVLMLTCPERFLGKYLVIEQGLETRIACDFSWMYGSVEPNATFGDVLMSHWTAAQKNLGYSSTLIEGEEEVWVYGKEGYIKLGNDRGAGADFITPHNYDFQYDTLLVVSFKAVVQNGDILPDYTGGTEPIVPMSPARAPRRAEGKTVDDNSLTVEVSGGGYIRDFVGTGGTSLQLQLPTYDMESARYPYDIFDGASFLVFIEGTDSNPITVDTSIRIIAGDMKVSGGDICNRVFLDDLFVYRQDLLLDEDMFIANGGKSGRDIISGGQSNDQ